MYTKMKNILLPVFLTIAFTASVQAQDLKAELEAYAKTFQEANNRGDAEALNAMYADEVAMVNPQDGSKTTVTRAQIKEQDLQNFSQVSDQMNIVVDSAESQPDGRVRVRGSVTGVSTNKKTGEKTNYSGAYDHLVTKVDGQWKLCEMKFLPK